MSGIPILSNEQESVIGNIGLLKGLQVLEGVRRIVRDQTISRECFDGLKRALKNVEEIE